MSVTGSTDPEEAGEKRVLRLEREDRLRLGWRMGLRRATLRYRCIQLAFEEETCLNRHSVKAVTWDYLRSDCVNRQGHPALWPSSSSFSTRFFKRSTERYITHFRVSTPATVLPTVTQLTSFPVQPFRIRHDPSPFTLLTSKPLPPLIHPSKRSR